MGNADTDFSQTSAKRLASDVSSCARRSIRGRGREIGVPRAAHVAFRMLPGAAPQFWSVPEAGPGWERAGLQSNKIVRHS